MNIPVEIWSEILEYILIPRYTRTCRLFYTTGIDLLNRRINHILGKSWRDYDIRDAELLMKLPSLDARFNSHAKRIVEIVVRDGRVDLLHYLSKKELPIGSWIRINAIDYSSNMDCLRYAIIHQWIDVEWYVCRAIEDDRKDILRCIIDCDNYAAEIIRKNCLQSHKPYLLDELLVRDY